MATGRRVLAVLILSVTVAQGDIVCPDGSTCSNDTTCCQLLSGEYGCCPLPNAICCSDKMHCCPSGHQCDVKEKRCFRRNEVKATLLEQSTPVGLPERNDEYVKCPDESYCSDGNTCCLTASGHYGCCPFAHAECCSDGRHCCPEGFQCSVSGVCMNGYSSVPMARKRPSMSQQTLLSLQSQYVKCPDQSFCPDGNTCCLLTSGRYACCPYSHAVCCSDHKSCCPEGYRCIVSAGACMRGSVVAPMSSKSPSLSLETVLSLLNE